MLDTRRKIVGGVAGLVALAAVVYGVVQVLRPNDPYEGLTLWRETQIDDATRATLEQRMATTRAGIAAAEAAGQDPDTTLWLSLADDAYIMGDLVTAREAYEEALNDNSMNPAVWNSYANVTNRMGDLEPAERAYLQAANIAPVTQYYMDYVAFLKKHYPERDNEVKTVLEYAIDQLGRNETLMVGLAEWYEEHGDCQRAIDHYKVAQSLNPANEGIAQKIQDVRTTCVQTE